MPQHTPSSFDALLSTWKGRKEALSFISHHTTLFASKTPGPVIWGEAEKLQAYAWRAVYASSDLGQVSEVEAILPSLEKLLKDEGRQSEIRRFVFGQYMKTAEGREKVAISFVWPLQLWLEAKGRTNQSTPPVLYTGGMQHLSTFDELLALVTEEDEAVAQRHSQEEDAAIRRRIAEAGATSVLGRDLTASLSRYQRDNPYAVIRARYGDYRALVSSYWPSVGNVGIND